MWSAVKQADLKFLNNFLDDLQAKQLLIPSIAIDQHLTASDPKQRTDILHRRLQTDLQHLSNHKRTMQFMIESHRSHQPTKSGDLEFLSYRQKLDKRRAEILELNAAIHNRLNVSRSKDSLADSSKQLRAADRHLKIIDPETQRHTKTMPQVKTDLTAYSSDEPSHNNTDLMNKFEETAADQKQKQTLQLDSLRLSNKNPMSSSSNFKFDSTKLFRKPQLANLTNRLGAINNREVKHPIPPVSNPLDIVDTFPLPLRQNNPTNHSKIFTVKSPEKSPQVQESADESKKQPSRPPSNRSDRMAQQDEHADAPPTHRNRADPNNGTQAINNKSLATQASLDRNIINAASTQTIQPSTARLQQAPHSSMLKLSNHPSEPRRLAHHPQASQQPIRDSDTATDLDLQTTRPLSRRQSNTHADSAGLLRARVADSVDQKSPKQSSEYLQPLDPPNQAEKAAGDIHKIEVRPDTHQRKTDSKQQITTDDTSKPSDERPTHPRLTLHRRRDLLPREFHQESELLQKQPHQRLVAQRKTVAEKAILSRQLSQEISRTDVEGDKISVDSSYTSLSIAAADGEGQPKARARHSRIVKAVGNPGIFYQIVDRVKEDSRQTTGSNLRSPQRQSIAEGLAPALHRSLDQRLAVDHRTGDCLQTPDDRREDDAARRFLRCRGDGQ